MRRPSRRPRGWRRGSPGPVPIADLLPRPQAVDIAGPGQDVISTPDGASPWRGLVDTGEQLQGGAGPVGAGSLKFVERGVVVGEQDREAVAKLLGWQVLKRLLFDELSAERGDVDASAIRSVEHAGQGGP